MASTIQTSVVLPETGYVRLSTILSVFPVSKSTWWEGIKEGRYPAGIKRSIGVQKRGTAPHSRLIPVVKRLEIFDGVLQDESADEKLFQAQRSTLE